MTSSVSIDAAAMPRWALYRDKDNPARVSEQFEAMIGRGAELPNVLPELRRYLLQYPESELPGADSFFYWEKVNFGLSRRSG